MNCHTTNISKYFDYHIQPKLKEIGSYKFIYKATEIFLKTLEKVKDIPKGKLLVKLGIKSLFTNVPKNKGIKREKMVSTKTITNFLSLILMLNIVITFNLVFNCKH